MSRLTFLATAALTAVLAACGKTEVPVKTAAVPDGAPQQAAPAQSPGVAPNITFTPLPPPETPAPAPAPAPAVAIASLALGNAIGPDMRIQGVTGIIAPNDVVYLSVETAGGGDATLKSRWTFHKDGKATVVKEESQHVAPGGPATLAFQAERPGGWPKGDYQVEVFVNGTAAASQRFTVA
jgi:hypothetical protein